MLDATEFNLQFYGNTYNDCNQVDKGAVFFLEEGARLRDEASDYSDCSALAGGLAFVTGHGTYLKITKPRGYITSMFAYQGGVFYAEKGATVEMTEAVTIKYSHAYEGTAAYVVDRAHFFAYNDIHIQYNKVFRRGVFSVTDGSQIYIDDAEISNNKVGFDSAVIHAENNRIEYHLDEGPDSNVFLESWLENS